MSAALELARALGAKRSGRQWVCRCPAHDDHTPSLIFWQGHSAIRFKCYAGCAPRDILDALRGRGLLDGHGARREHERRPVAPNGDRRKREDEDRARIRRVEKSGTPLATHAARWSKTTFAHVGSCSTAISPVVCCGFIIVVRGRTGACAR